mmetsp:Transcript_11104/g.34050  ORF Transcript_11104/g.34050 Transcript_11104/m.34050 type:complete len:441 (+) Transcript_11104:474-1796(+)
MGEKGLFLSGTPPRMSGELDKEGKKLHGRKTRYFRLIDGALYNHRKKNSPATWGLSVLDCRISANSNKSEITLHVFDGKEVKLFPKNDAICEEWMKALNRASKRKIGIYYGVTGIIGTGSFAEVRLGYNKANGDQVAIKIMKKNKRDKELMTSVACEMNFVERRLQHDKIVHTYDVFNTKENLFIVMEYMPGGMLFDLLHNEGHFSERKAAGVMKDLLQSLEFLHSNDIVHRDIKPENVLCTKKEWPMTVKLADFGLADIMLENAYGDKCARGMYGTPFFVAPEVIKGENYGPGVDVWSAGVLMYNMLSGQLPFDGNSLKEVLRNVKSGRFNFPDKEWKTVSQEAKDLIEGLLALAPKDRLSAKEALASKWITNENLSDEPLNLNRAGFKDKRTSSMAFSDVRDVTDNHADDKEATNIFKKGGIFPKKVVELPAPREDDD